MSDIDLPEADTVTVGWVGEPGKRVFYLQAWGGGRVHSLKMEKQQVAALGAAIAELLDDVVVDDPVALPDVLDPGQPDWIVGTMALTSIDSQTGRAMLLLNELVRGGAGDPDDDADEDDAAGSTARFGLTLAQLAALSIRCEEAVAGGRPPCPLCGRPMDPLGHVCPKTNGSSKR